MQCVIRLAAARLFCWQGAFCWLSVANCSADLSGCEVDRKVGQKLVARLQLKHGRASVKAPGRTKSLLLC
eukprot:1685687-Rhodomonas_salina.1